MCGIIGFVGNDIKLSRFRESLDLIKHRGPDNLNLKTYYHLKKKIILGHARLSIIDLNKRSNQPFVSKCKRYKIIYNGEIYNFLEIKKLLKNKGYKFLTQSDTEVLLYAIIEWGMDILKKLEGMFSFCVYDSKNNILHLARDAFGMKPLYYSNTKGNFSFSSELPSLVHLSGNNDPNLQLAYDYIVHGYCDSYNKSFVNNIYKLPPATFLMYDIKKNKILKKKWWKLKIKQNNKITFDDASKKINEIFVKNVSNHSISDVPISVALSGGVDSSSIYYTLKYLNKKKFNSYSYIAKDKLISEDYFINKILKSDKKHKIQKVKIKINEFKKDFENLVFKSGEPFGSLSIYAQYKLYQQISIKNKVCLDGQGADEALGGYLGYPGFKIKSLIENNEFYKIFIYLKSWKINNNKNFFLPIGYFLRNYLPDNIYEFLRKCMGRNFKPNFLDIHFLQTKGIDFREKRLNKFSKNLQGQRAKEAMKNAIEYTGLPNLLRNGDRTSMAFGVESRLPFLTIKFIELLFSLPENYLISDKGRTKYIFKHALKAIVPSFILDRKLKIGFEADDYKIIFSNYNFLKKKIIDSKNINFLNKTKFLHIFQEARLNKKKYNPFIWRIINYYKWHDLVLGKLANSK